MFSILVFRTLTQPHPILLILLLLPAHPSLCTYSGALRRHFWSFGSSAIFCWSRSHLPSLLSHPHQTLHQDSAKLNLFCFLALNLFLLSSCDFRLFKEHSIESPSQPLNQYRCEREIFFPPSDLYFFSVPIRVSLHSNRDSVFCLLGVVLFRLLLFIASMLADQCDD